ncbi:MAG: histidine kinase [Ignavibacteria bacterium]
MKYKRSIFWILQLTIWSLYYLYNLNVVHGLSLPDERELVALYLVLYAYFAIPLTLILRIIFNRLGKKSMSNWIFAAAVFSAIFIAANIWALEVYFLDRLFEGESRVLTPVNLKFYLWEVLNDFLVLLAWSAFYLIIKLWYEWQTEKEKANTALLQAQQSQLSMLRNQINPHFLFNTLSSLRALVRDNQKKAEDMLTKISEFLRYSLVSKKEIKVPFSEELNALQNYIDIERVRYGENLETTFKIDSMAEDYPVLSFLLHPIVENAIKYGMDTSTMPLKLEIFTNVLDNTLKIQIINSGKWINESEHGKNSGTGMGLKIVKERLKHLYGDDQKFEINKQNGKVSVLIELKNKSAEKDEH